MRPGTLFAQVREHVLGGLPALWTRVKVTPHTGQSIVVFTRQV
jgi:hypothetical protein